MKCEYCREEISLWQTHYNVGDLTVCKDCLKNHREEILRKQKGGDPVSKEPEINQNDLSKIILTTETYLNDIKIKERLGIISSESVLGMNVFRDLFAGVRDVVGGRSVSTQKILKDLKSTAFQELKEEAYKAGADAVIAIDLDYSEFSGGGKSMLFLVVTGTAVKFQDNKSS